MKTDLFQSCGHCWVFHICWHIEFTTFMSSSFMIWFSLFCILCPPFTMASSCPTDWSVHYDGLKTAPYLTYFCWLFKLFPVINTHNKKGEMVSIFMSVEVIPGLWSHLPELSMVIISSFLSWHSVALLVYLSISSNSSSVVSPISLMPFPELPVWWWRKAKQWIYKFTEKAKVNTKLQWNTREKSLPTDRPSQDEGQKWRDQTIWNSLSSRISGGVWTQGNMIMTKVFNSLCLHQRHLGLLCCNHSCFEWDLDTLSPQASSLRLSAGTCMTQIQTVQSACMSLSFLIWERRMP